MTRHLNLSLTSAFQAGSFEAERNRSSGTLPRLARFLEGGRPDRAVAAALSASRYESALEALDREITRIRLQSRHWLM